MALGSNRGFAGGANAGLAAAHGDVVALLNDDAVAPEGWLTGSAALLASGKVAAVGPKVLLAGSFAEYRLDDDDHFAEGDARPLGRQVRAASADGDDVLTSLVGPGLHALEVDGDDRWRWSAGRRPFFLVLGEGAVAPVLDLDGVAVPPARVVDLVNTAGTYLRRDGYAGDCGAHSADDGQWDAARSCFGVSGCALVTTADVLGRVGTFAPGYFAYYEDTDWCWRARLEDLDVVYEPSLVVRHVGGQTSGGTASARVRFLAERNRLCTLARCAPLPLALDEARRKYRGGGDDGVAEVLPRALAAAFAQRASMWRRRSLSPTECFERWAGVDVPAP